MIRLSLLSSVRLPISKLKDGGLIIIHDDINTHIGSIIGLGEYVTADKVNLMTKIGRGLVYACITEERARQLNVSKMVDSIWGDTKPCSVLVDYKIPPTGISSSERADTIKALTSNEVEAADFKRPGHIIPLISKERGLLERVDITEAVIHLVKLVSPIHVGYMIEIFNANGEVAGKDEIEEVSKLNSLPIIPMSDLLTLTKDQEFCSFSGIVINGRKIGRGIGFPTANLHPKEPIEGLLKGVYGVKVFFQGQKYIGVMNVGNRPTFNAGEESIHYEVHIFDFDQEIYWKNIDIQVCFYLRDEISFLSIADLINQIKTDVKSVKQRFNLIDRK